MPKFNTNPTPLEIQRRKAGLTRRELAEKSGISFRTLECYEQLKNNINGASVITVKKLADTLGCTIDDIINKD